MTKGGSNQGGEGGQLWGRTEEKKNGIFLFIVFIIFQLFINILLKKSTSAIIDGTINDLDMIYPI